VKGLTGILILAGLALLAPATASAAPRACTKSVIEQKILHQDLLTQGQLDDAGIDVVICGDLNGDGRAEGLFTVGSGGTAGDTHAGVLKGGPNNGVGAVAVWTERVHIAVRRRNSTTFEMSFPDYAPDDPQCCASAYRIWRYVWRTNEFGFKSWVHTSSRTVSEPPAGFKGG